MDEPRFPYTIRDYKDIKDGRCCASVSESGGWHFFRCRKPVKKTIDNVGLCGIHARMLERWRK